MQRVMLTALLLSTSLAFADTNLIIRGGGSVICRTNLTVVSGGALIENGGSLALDGASVTCQDFQLDAGAALSASSSSTLEVSDYWINQSDFVRPRILAMPKTVSSMSEANMAPGFGDTDGFDPFSRPLPETPLTPDLMAEIAALPDVLAVTPDLSIDVVGRCCEKQNVLR